MFHHVVRPIPIYHQVAMQIEETIISGQLNPGQKLPSERKLAEKFEVSRRTLREAMRVIEQKGLIEIKRGGAFVKASSLDQLSESLGLLIRYNKVPWNHLAEFRLEIDTLVTRKAVLNAREKDIKMLEGLIEKGKALLKDHELNWKGLVEVDLRIHLALAKMSGNQIFEWILRIVLDNILRQYENAEIDQENFAKDSFQDMIGLVEAVKQRDTERAVSVIRDHVLILSKKYFEESAGMGFPLVYYSKRWGGGREDWVPRAITDDSN